jgi:hypothetical protein
MSNMDSIKTSKFSERDTRIIIAQLYVARKLNVSPDKVIKFILSNREYFPYVNDDIIELIIKEKGLSWDIINQLPEIHFADIDAGI